MSASNHSIDGAHVVSVGQRADHDERGSVVETTRDSRATQFRALLSMVLVVQSAFALIAQGRSAIALQQRPDGWMGSEDTTTNVPPIVGPVRPSSGKLTVGKAHRFITVYRDPNGHQDLRRCHFLIATGREPANAVYLYYDARANKLYMRSSDGKKWIGGYAPGSAKLIQNAQGKLLCKRTWVTAVGSSITVRWAILFRTRYTGRKSLYMRAVDSHGLRTSLENRGAIRIVREPRSTPTLTETPTWTPTTVASSTHTPTPTHTPSATATSTISPSPTWTQLPTSTGTPTASLTWTATPSPTETLTPSPTWTRLPTPTPTPTLAYAAFTIGHITDAHIGEQWIYSQRLPGVVQVISQQAEVMVDTGDCTHHGTAQETLEYLNLVNSNISVPWRAVPGNHDKSEIFAQYIGPLEWSWDVGGYRLIGINTEAINYTALDQALSAQKPCIVFGHFPLSYCTPTDQVKLRQRFEAYNVPLYVAGHMHEDSLTVDPASGTILLVGNNAGLGDYRLVTVQGFEVLDISFENPWQ